MNLRSRLERAEKQAPEPTEDAGPDTIARFIVGADGRRGPCVYRRNLRTGETWRSPDYFGAPQP